MFRAGGIFGLVGLDNIVSGMEKFEGPDPAPVFFLSTCFWSRFIVLMHIFVSILAVSLTPFDWGCQSTR